MEQKHTPGPYRIEKPCGFPYTGTYIVPDKACDSKGFPFFIAEIRQLREKEESDANADLFVAAPSTARQRDEFRSLLIKCYQYMQGTKHGPDAITLTEELYKTMEKIGIVGTASAAISDAEKEKV